MGLAWWQWANDASSSWIFRLLIFAPTTEPEFFCKFTPLLELSLIFCAQEFIFGSWYFARQQAPGGGGARLVLSRWSDAKGASSSIVGGRATTITSVLTGYIIYFRKVAHFMRFEMPCALILYRAVHNEPSSRFRCEAHYGYLDLWNWLQPWI